MRFEWGEDKRKENIRKHGIDFVGVEKVFDGYTVTILDDRVDYGEDRCVAFGLMGGRVVAVTHTERQNVTRIISIRKATSGEEENYFSQIPD